MGSAIPCPMIIQCADSVGNHWNRVHGTRTQRIITVMRFANNAPYKKGKMGHEQGIDCIGRRACAGQSRVCVVSVVQSKGELNQWRTSQKLINAVLTGLKMKLVFPAL